MSKANSQRRAATKKTSTKLVGLGASAGGLKALQGFFDAMPPECGLAFAVVMHLDPERASGLAELLQARTSMKVRQVDGRVDVEPDHVYVIPPAKRILSENGRLRAVDFDQPRGHRTPIDQFFRSLAEAPDPAFAVLLSGGGSDGVTGLRAIKANGGVVFAQTPSEADIDSMPRSAIDAGVVDFVLPVRELAMKLADLAQCPDLDAGLPPESDDATLKRVLSHLRTRTGHDFSEYKRSTLARRIARRMQVHGKRTLRDYYELQRANAGESKALLYDLLIGVTAFFRDPAAFDALEKDVLPLLFADKESDRTIRVWVPGCGTGEEAYSIAMLLLDYASRLDFPPQIQVFASDLDERALAIGREGSYPRAIEVDVPERFLQRYFLESGDRYEVIKELREVTLFATHNLTCDPPFSRLDFISCRNLLIYLERSLQQRVFGIFRYALVPEGCLFLGGAEAPVGAAEHDFQPISKKHRLFQVRKEPGDRVVLPEVSLPIAMTASKGDPPHGPRAETLHQRILDSEGPPSVLIDQRSNVVNLSEGVGRYLLTPGGPPTHELTQLARPELQLELRSAIHRAFEKGERSLTRPMAVRIEGSERRVQLLVQPAKGGPQAARMALVVFIEHEESPEPDEGASKAGQVGDRNLAALQAQLRQTQEELQAVRARAAKSTEELKAANEELQSINEEYRSTTEELETSKEELQSINEELQTVNGELQENLKRAAQANADLENLIQATDIGTLFLDSALRIMRFSPPLADLFHIRSSDKGRPLADLRRRLVYEDLEADLERTLRGETVECDVRSENGRWHSIRLRPYVGPGQRIEGVVVTFFDITNLKTSEANERAAKEQAELVIDTVRQGLLILDDQLVVQSASRTFLELFVAAGEEIEGRSLRNLGDPWAMPEILERVEAVADRGEAFDRFEVVQDLGALGRRTLLLNARRFRHGPLLLLAVDDITEHKASQEALRLSERRLGLALDAARMTAADWIPGREDIEIGGDFQALFGIPAPQTVQEAHALLHPQDRPEHTGEAWPPEAVHGEFRIIHPQTGELHWLEGWGVEVASEQARHFVGVAMDISERKRIELAARELNLTLEQRVNERTAEVRDLSSRLTIAEHRERDRIAHILHDDLQQVLYSIQLKMVFLRSSIEAGSRAESLQLTGEAEAWLQQAVRTSRELSVDLSPQVLETEGLTEALRWLSSQLQELHGLEVEIEADDGLLLPAATRVLLFQATREVLFNVVKHSGVHAAHVKLSREGGALMIRVRDEGSGFDVEALNDNSGFGMLSVRHRLSLLGGRIHVESCKGEGTTVTIEAPTEPESSS